MVVVGAITCYCSGIRVGNIFQVIDLAARSSSRMQHRRTKTPRSISIQLLRWVSRCNHHQRRRQPKTPTTHNTTHAPNGTNNSYRPPEAQSAQTRAAPINAQWRRSVRCRVRHGMAKKGTLCSI